MSYRDVKRGLPQRESKVIAVINQKGGVGKSTSVINLSACLGENKKKVLVIDFDPQGNSTSGYGIEKDELEHDVYDVILDDFPIEDAIIETCEPNVFIVPATIQLATAEIELVSLEKRESVLKEAVSRVKNEFDYVFIDCPPSLELLTVNALCAAGSLLVPVQCEYYALEGLSDLLATVRLVKRGLNPKLAMEGVLLTMFDSRTNLSLQVAEEVKRHFPGQVYATVIPRNVRLSEAPSHGKPVLAYDKWSRGAEAYEALAEEFHNKNKA